MVMIQIISKALVFEFMSSLISASPLDTTHLIKRNACDWTGVEPILYHDYLENDCPAPYKFADDKGNCEIHGITDGNFKPLCETYCQVRTAYFYGQEQIFMRNPYCFGTKGGMTCSITETMTTTYTLSASFSPGLKAEVISLQPIPRSYAIKLDENECSYWTFLPILKGVCGSYTKGTKHHTTWDPRVTCSAPVSQSNICYNMPQYNFEGGEIGGPGGLGKGDTVFVRTDCANRQPFPPAQQNPAYNHPGVALPRSIYEAYSREFFEAGTATPLSISSPIKCETPIDAATIVDCDHALEILVKISSATILNIGGDEDVKRAGAFAWPAVIFDDEDDEVLRMKEHCIDILSDRVNSGPQPHQQACLGTGPQNSMSPSSCALFQFGCRRKLAINEAVFPLMPSLFK
ncbi:hypothetical protein BKA65DRAFT_471313 [Rhexocercosporidium sp. MPI-PUGE-AT-0058]|nr:hypothetical protein BKA65DRAFT_471313 [Rhexocercosporidium sp. MPI-PUGE-AT-0058]